MDVSTLTPGGPAPVRVRDLPVVFLSYDEPWAEACWKDLVSKIPAALRVDGITGLDACHKAAAQAAGTDWFITVDADTTIAPEFAALEIPAWLFEPTLRPTWYSRNAVNGLVSGNGSLKLWPSAIVDAMRSHEAAPDGAISIDHDIEQIEAGRTQRVQMPGCYAVTDPARTAFHAFRAGLRECAYLAHVLQGFRADARKTAKRADMLGQVISVWCTLGRHHPHGLWMILGARLGLRAVLDPTGWDIRKVNSYEWLENFWANRVHARFGAEGTTGRELKGRWNNAQLEAEVRGHGTWIAEHSEVEIVEVNAAESRLIVEAGIMPAVRSANAVDAIGRAFQIGSGVTQSPDVAHRLFEEAAAMLHPSALYNLGQLHETGTAGPADPVMAERYYAASAALGNVSAPKRLARLIRATGELSEAGNARVMDRETPSAASGGTPTKAKS